MERRVEMSRSLRMNLVKRVTNMTRHHRHMLVHVVTVSIEQLIQTIPITSWAHNLNSPVTATHRLCPKDRKRALLRLFWSCTLPNCSSTTPKCHVQPPPISTEIGTMFTGLAGRINTIFLHLHCRKTLATHPKIINEPPIVRNGRHPPKNSGMFSFLCVMHAMATKMNPNGSKIVFLNGIVTVKSSKMTTVWNDSKGIEIKQQRKTRDDFPHQQRSMPRTRCHGNRNIPPTPVNTNKNT